MIEQFRPRIEAGERIFAATEQKIRQFDRLSAEMGFTVVVGDELPTRNTRGRVLRQHTVTVSFPGGKR